MSGFGDVDVAAAEPVCKCRYCDGNNRCIDRRTGEKYPCQCNTCQRARADSPWGNP